MTLWAMVDREPFASLMAYGVKTAETRGNAPRTTVQPGDRLAIVSARKVFAYDEFSEAWDALAEAMRYGANYGRRLAGLFAAGAAKHHYPGAVVAVVTYDEALRIADVPGDADDGIFHDVTDGEAWAWTGSEDRDITDQLPLGDFTPGRYGWMLSNPLRLAVPVPCPAVAPDGSRTNMQGVFRLPAAVEAAVVAQIGGES